MGRKSSIKRKLIGIIMLTCNAGLLLAASLFIVTELFSFREALVKDLSTLAKIIADHSTAAIAFNEPKIAEEVLSALHAKPHIRRAFIFNKYGQVFAAYPSLQPVDRLIEFREEKAGVRFEGRRLALFDQIVLDNERIGMIYFESDFQDLYARLQEYVAIVVVVLLAAILVAFLIATRLQRKISEPILQLSDVTRIFTDEKDFAIRAKIKHEGDEFGVLIEGFNAMLDEIEHRDLELRQHRDHMEVMVKMRTEQLSSLNEKLKEQAAQLMASNRELEAFTYSVSHDLRAPIGNIHSACEFILKDYGHQIDQRHKEFLDRILGTADRMVNLIDSLLQLSRVGKLEMRLERVDLSDLAGAIAREKNEKEPERNVQWVIQSELFADADKGLMKILLENLLGNAWKFTSQRSLARIELGVLCRDNKKIFFVRDNGAGFDMRYKEKLFQPFERLHGNREFPGTGIGLATVARIIERHGGQIWTEAAVDQGATFYFTLPPGP